jgi:uncharacterized protein (TIGR02996 family)
LNVLTAGATVCEDCGANLTALAGTDPRPIPVEEFVYREPGATPEGSEENALLRAIIANPGDEGPRLVYADWLEERGDPRSELLRLEAALSRIPPTDERSQTMTARVWELRAACDPDWLTVLARSEVELCDFEFQYQCPKQWDRLRLTPDRAVRFCETCRQQVFYCATVRQARGHARQGHCVALDAQVVRTPGDLDVSPPLLMGIAAPPPDTDRAARDILERYLRRAHEPGGPDDGLRPGAQVTITTGRYRGRPGEIQSVDRESQRARVVIRRWFRGRVSVELDTGDFELRP